MTRDPLQFCIYCGADCYQDDPPHTDGCPQRTGVYPVDQDMLDPPRGPAQCCRCDHEFTAGDFYHHLKTGENGLGIPIYEIVCAGCAAHDALAEEKGT